MTNFYCPMAKIIILIVIMLFSFASIAEGSCWRYGHACWGGHGKRSGPSPTLKPLEYSLLDSHELVNIPSNRDLNSENDFSELNRRDPPIQFRSVESNEAEIGESEEKGTIYMIADDPILTNSAQNDHDDQQITENEKFSQMANRNGANSDYISDVSDEEDASKTQISFPHFSSSLNPQWGNRIRYKIALLHRKNAKNVM